jgi:hypothetical protein
MKLIETNENVWGKLAQEKMKTFIPKSNNTDTKAAIREHKIPITLTILHLNMKYVCNYSCEGHIAFRRYDTQHNDIEDIDT